MKSEDRRLYLDENQQKIFGTGILLLNNQSLNGSLEFYINKELIIFKVEKEKFHGNLNEILNNDIQLSCELQLQTGKVKSQSSFTGHVFNFSLNHSRSDSILNRALKLTNEDVGLLCLAIRINNRNLILKTENEFISTECELIFECPFPFSKRTEIKIDQAEILLNGGNEITILRSQSNILQHEESLALALSICHGRRINFLSGFYNSEIRIAFWRRGFKSGVNPIFDKLEDYSLFIFLLIKRIEESDDGDIKLKRAMEYLIQGFDGRQLLEFRVINLFTSLEIIDKASKLDKGNISREFKLSKDSAQLIVDTRNILIHEGLSLNYSIRKAYQKLKQSGGNRDEGLPFDLDKLDQSIFGRKFYFWLIQILLGKVFEMIDFPKKEIFKSFL